jgi:hypothetical protein
VKQRGLSAQFIAIPEAKEYRETLALKSNNNVESTAGVETTECFAPTLFAKGATSSANHG